MRSFNTTNHNLSHLDPLVTCTCTRVCVYRTTRIRYVRDNDDDVVYKTLEFKRFEEIRMYLGPINSRRFRILRCRASVVCVYTRRTHVNIQRAPTFFENRKTEQSLKLIRPSARSGPGTSIRGPQCAFEMSMFMCPAVHKLTRN